MKVLFLTRWYPPHGGIFIERHVQAVNLFNEIAVLAVLPGEKSSGLKPVIDDQFAHTGYPVIRYFYRPSGSRILILAGMINLIKFLSGSFAGYRYISRHYGPFDLLHVHILTRAAVLPWLLSILKGKPYIISEHWTRYFPANWGFTGIIRRMLTRHIVRHASVVTAVSEYLKNAMLDCGLANRRFQVIPNAIDTGLFTIGEKRTETRVKRMIHVSNLHERAKNIRGILRVIKLLGEKRQDFDMVFVGGDGPWLEEARKYAAGLGLAEPHVIFTGRMQPAVLAKAYQESSFLLMFSNFESFSVVIPEALASGTPVIATAAGGIPEYFDPRAGILVSPGNEADLLDKVNYMLDHYQSYDPHYLRSLIENRFGFETVGQQFDNLYRSVLEKGD